ncbi:S66 peptidase family protein [Occallatibacter savannae]|uniref:S66 peptidase family protein n=1 Tax=Occallatibacter savannae TaxID=1002691 RepID=UPI000D69B761|nr:LD-carboxypeptidase [Occallatibacter savannae]
MSEAAKPLIRMPAVSEGAKVSVISPASFAIPERVDRGLDRLRELGFSPRTGMNTQARGPLFFAGSAESRLADLHAAFVDPETSFVVAVRGGYGSNYLLEGIDRKLIASNPKPFFAYSDMTGLQCHFLDEFGLPAFHGPMVAADFYLENGVHLESFQAAIAGRPYSLGEAEGLRTLRPGTARGTLYGGCLSILVAMLGTQWEPQTEGKLLFIEDVSAKPYQIDRMLWHLRQAGKLEGVLGIVFGEMLDCSSPGAADDLLESAILSALAGLDVPIAFGLRSGHVSRQNVTLTFGVEAELRAGDEAQLALLEPAVQS